MNLFGIGSGLKSSPQKYVQVLTPGTMNVILFGNRLFTDVIKYLKIKPSWILVTGHKVNIKKIAFALTIKE